MSNLRSDALHFASTMTIDSPCSTYITRLCCQIDEVEERWHKAERDLAAAHARIERLREALRSLEWFKDSIRETCPYCLGWKEEGHHPGCRYVKINNDLGEPPAAAKEKENDQ